MFELLLFGSLSILGVGFYNMEDAPKKDTPKEAVEIMAEYDDVDLELLLSEQKVTRRVTKGKPRFTYRPSPNGKSKL